MQTALATLAVLQKTGALNVAFKGLDIGKNLFQKMMGINAGVVNVNGPVNMKGLPAGAAGATPRGR